MGNSHGWWFFTAFPVFCLYWGRSGETDSAGSRNWQPKGNSLLKSCLETSCYLTGSRNYNIVCVQDWQDGGGSKWLYCCFTELGKVTSAGGTVNYNAWRTGIVNIVNISAWPQTVGNSRQILFFSCKDTEEGICFARLKLHAIFEALYTQLSDLLWWPTVRYRWNNREVNEMGKDSSLAIWHNFIACFQVSETVGLKNQDLFSGAVSAGAWERSSSLGSEIVTWTPS